MNNDFKAKGVARDIRQSLPDRCEPSLSGTVAREKVAIDAMLETLLYTTQLTHDNIGTLESRLEVVSTPCPDGDTYIPEIGIYGSSTVFLRLQEIYNMLHTANQRIELARIKLEI